MPPDPVTGFCILPRSATMSSTAARMASADAAGGFPQLAVGRGVQVQPVHRDPDLVGPDHRAGVQPPGGLRQHPGGLEHPVQAEW